MNRKIASAVIVLVLAAAAGYGLVRWYGRSSVSLEKAAPSVPAQTTPSTPASV